MTIVYFFEKVHIHHDEDQIAMIQLSNVAAAGSLVISKNLPSFCRKNFFEIAPVPHSGQRIGKGNFLELKILALQFQTVPPQRLFLALQLVFQFARFVEILPATVAAGGAVRGPCSAA